MTMKKFLMSVLRFLGMAFVAGLSALILWQGAICVEAGGYARLFLLFLAAAGVLLYWAWRVIWTPIQPASNPARGGKLVLLALLAAVIAVPSYQAIRYGRDLEQELKTLDAMPPMPPLPPRSGGRFPVTWSAHPQWVRSDMCAEELQFGMVEFAVGLVFLLYVTLERGRAKRLRKARRNAPVAKLP